MHDRVWVLVDGAGFTEEEIAAGDQLSAMVEDAEERMQPFYTLEYDYYYTDVRPTTLWPGERTEEEWKTVPQARPVADIVALIRRGELIPPDQLIVSRWHSRDFRAYPDTPEQWKPWNDYVAETLEQFSTWYDLPCLVELGFHV